MKYDVDSDHQGISFLHGPRDTGRNRVDLVLQSRAANADSDLAWEDATILASHVVGEEDADTSGFGGVLDAPFDLSATARTIAAAKTRIGEETLKSQRVGGC